MLKDHGQRAKEANRGQQPITQKDFARIPTVVLNPDNIKLSDKLFEGKPVILFEKEINGRKTVVAYVTKKHMDLTVQTMYFGKEKGSRPTTPSDASSIVLQTSETLSGNAPITKVADASDVVNFSAKDPVEKKGHAACHPQSDGREAAKVPRAGRRAHAQHRGHTL